MDWLNQNRYKNLLIAALVMLNIITIAIIWYQIFREPDYDDRRLQAKNGPESVNLLQQELKLDTNQLQTIRKNRTGKLEQMKEINDELQGLKQQMVTELMKDQPDSGSALRIAKQIGTLQEKVELARFFHFRDILSICTPEQRRKLQPILSDVFTKKPPKDLRAELQQAPGRPKDKPEPEPEVNARSKPEETGEAVPKWDYKLKKYAQRLDLTDQQIEKVKIIFRNSEQRGKKLHQDNRMSDSESLTQKEKLRQEEDAEIRKLLTPEQQTEFDRMQSKRKKDM